MNINESLNIFIKEYYTYCLKLVNDPYYGSILQNSKETLVLYFNENERIHDIFSQIFISFIKKMELSYEHYKFIIEEKDDINAYILFLILKHQ